MNLTQIIQTVGDEISAAIDNLSKSGITVASVDAEIEMHAIGMDGAAEFTRTVKVNGLTNRLINSGALMQANDPSSATRPTRALDCNLDAMAGFAAAHG